MAPAAAVAAQRIMDMPAAEFLRLVALDEEDLSVLSAHVQDAVLTVSDLAWRPAERRFAIAMNRFNWEGAVTRPGDRNFERRRSILHFDRVLAAKTQNINPKATGAVLELLAIEFKAGDPPAGSITLTFAGGGAVRLEVECIEAQLTDLGAAWAAKSAPAHDISDVPVPPGAKSGSD